MGDLTRFVCEKPPTANECKLPEGLEDPAGRLTTCSLALCCHLPPQQAAAACLVQYHFSHAQDSGGTHNSFLSAELPPLTRYEVLLEAPWPFSQRHLYRGLKTGSQKVSRPFRTKLLCGRSIKSPNRENQGPDELSEQDQSKLEILSARALPTWFLRLLH